jgi:hypothetical protein
VIQTELNGSGPNASAYIPDKSFEELLRDKSKVVVIGVCDGNRFKFFVSRPFVGRLTERDVKALAGRLEVTIRVKAEEEGNILK